MTIITTQQSMPLNSTAPAPMAQNDRSKGSLGKHTVEALKLDQLIDQADLLNRETSNKRVMMQATAVITVVIVAAVILTWASGGFAGGALLAGCLVSGLIYLLCSEKHKPEIAQSRPELKNYINQHFNDIPLTPQMIVKIHKHMLAQPNPSKYEAGTPAREKCEAKIKANLERLKAQLCNHEPEKSLYQRVAAKLARFFANQAGTPVQA